MRHIYLFFSLLLLFGCIPIDKYGSTTIEFSASLPENGKAKTQHYSIVLPENGNLAKGADLFTGDFHTEYRITYNDSSIFYINNDYMNGSHLNFENRFSVRITGYERKHLLDTLECSGIQGNGKFWKECIMGDIVLGYLNASSSKKSSFDDSIAKFIKSNK